MDHKKIVTVTQYLSKETSVVQEEIKKLGLNPITLGNGKYIINQYPLANTKQLQVLKYSYLRMIKLILCLM